MSTKPGADPGGVRSQDLERLFFGRADSRGSEAVSYFENFQHPSVDRAAVWDLLTFMGLQKLRTPKGLEWLATEYRALSRDEVLRRMVELSQRNIAIWAECIWQIVDAPSSGVGFIISDHPVTIYNRSLGPRHRYCRGANDPDIRLHGSHTIFPLSSRRLLILTNSSWARNPKLSARGVRPNPDLFRDAMFNFLEIQTGRILDEQEMFEINFVIKHRAYRYVASACEDWLYPERHVSRSNWAEFGSGYLFMPDPRPLTPTSQYTMEDHKTVMEAATGPEGPSQGQLAQVVGSRLIRVIVLALIGTSLVPASADAAKNHMTRTEASQWVKAAVVESTNPYFLSGLDASFRCPTKVTKRRLRCKIKLTGYFGESVQTLRGRATVKLLPHRPTQGPNEYTLRVWGSFGQPGYKGRFDYVGGVKRYYGRYLRRA